MRHDSPIPHLSSFSPCEGHPEKIYASRTWSSAATRVAKVQLLFHLNQPLPSHILCTRPIPSPTSNLSPSLARPVPQLGWLWLTIGGNRSPLAPRLAAEALAQGEHAGFGGGRRAGREVCGARARLLQVVGMGLHVELERWARKKSCIFMPGEERKKIWVQVDGFTLQGTHRKWVLRWPVLEHCSRALVDTRVVYWAPSQKCWAAGVACERGRR